jgi:hypothetical protein
MISPTPSTIGSVRFPGARRAIVSSCTSSIRSMVLPEGPEFRKLPSGPPLSIVRPCFGQNCIECLAGSSTSGNRFALFRGTLDGGRGPPPRSWVPTAKAYDGKGKVWQSQDLRFWRRSECCSLLGRTFNSRRDLHWPCRVRAITTRNKSRRNTVVAANRVCARAGPAGRLPDLARDFSGVRFSSSYGRPVALRGRPEIKLSDFQSFVIQSWLRATTEAQIGLD